MGEGFDAELVVKRVESVCVVGAVAVTFDDEEGLGAVGEGSRDANAGHGGAKNGGLIVKGVGVNEIGDRLNFDGQGDAGRVPEDNLGEDSSGVVEDGCGGVIPEEGVGDVSVHGDKAELKPGVFFKVGVGNKEGVDPVAEAGGGLGGHFTGEDGSGKERSQISVDDVGDALGCLRLGSPVKSEGQGLGLHKAPHWLRGLSRRGFAGL